MLIKKHFGKKHMSKACFYLIQDKLKDSFYFLKKKKFVVVMKENIFTFVRIFFPPL